jgi:hypothetical protein
MRRSVLAVTTALVTVFVLTGAVAVAADSTAGWTAHTIPGTSSGSHKSSQIDCRSGGFCVETHGRQISVLRYGRVQSTVEAPLPSGAPDTAEADLTDVACASATSCVAVGAYQPGSPGGIGQPLVETYDGAVWTPTVVAADPSANTWFEELACNAVHCLAVASEGFPSFPTLFLRTGGQWTGQKVTFPAPIDTFTASYAGVACAPSGRCYVSMHANDTSTGDPTTYFAYPAGSGYRAVRSPVPTGVDPATASPGPMSCAGASACTVLALYATPSGDLAPYAETFDAGTLTAATIDTPVSFGSGSAADSYLDCPAVGACFAGVGFRPSAGGTLTLLGRLEGGAWHTRVAPPPPNPGKFRGPEGVACASVSVCVVAGSNIASAGAPRSAIVWTYSGGTWSVTVPQRTGGIAYTNFSLDDVACSVRRCYASGAAQVTSTDYKPLVAASPLLPTT